MATEKELKVLNKIYELSMEDSRNPYKAIHYLRLVDTIFTEEIQNKYKGSKITKMVCSYLGKMSRKDYINAAYEVTDAGYAFFLGYYLRDNGMKLLKK